MAKFDFGWSKADFSEHRKVDPDFDAKYDADPFYLFDEKFDDCSSDCKEEPRACGNDCCLVFQGDHDCIGSECEHADSRVIKWMWNGIKVDGKLHRAHYSMGTLVVDKESKEGHVTRETKEGYVTVYARDYTTGLPRLGGETVVNDSDGQTDYFERDRMRIAPDSKFYNDAVAAYQKQEQHNEKNRVKREARRNARRR